MRSDETDHEVEGNRLKSNVESHRNSNIKDQKIANEMISHPKLERMIT